MATITPTVTRAADPGVLDVYATAWAMGNADTGLPMQMSGASDRSVQASGTFGGATVKLEGSNDGVTYFTLNDPIGTDITGTSAYLYQIMELTRYIRPVTSGGTGTTITVTVLAKGQR